jgi:hypothetical protein
LQCLTNKQTRPIPSPVQHPSVHSSWVFCAAVTPTAGAADNHGATSRMQVELQESCLDDLQPRARRVSVARLDEWGWITTRKKKPYGMARRLRLWTWHTCSNVRDRTGIHDVTCNRDRTTSMHSGCAKHAPPTMGRVWRHGHGPHADWACYVLNQGYRRRCICIAFPLERGAAPSAYHWLRDVHGDSEDS